MNIILTIPDSAVPAYQAVVDKYNAGSGRPPVGIAGLAQIFQDETTARNVAQFEDAVRAELASNERLMALGKAVAVQPDKLDAVEAAVMKALQ